MIELDNFLVGYLSKRWKVSLEETGKRIESYRKNRNENKCPSTTRR